MTRTYLSVLGILLLIGVGLSFAPIVYGGAPSGLPSAVATTSSLQVGPQENKTLFSANSVCASRIVTTTASPIRILFDAVASTTLTGSIGHLQAASTTVAYDSGIYGCGLYRAYGYSSTTITISETQ